jgi:hypothetical protein
MDRLRQLLESKTARDYAYDVVGVFACLIWGWWIVYTLTHI